MWKAVLVAACLMYQPAPESATTPAAAPDAAGQVKQLVAQLDAREKAAREAAEQSLLGLGPAVLEHLPEPTPRMSAEVKQRLARVRSKLEKTLADSNKEASRITLTGAISLADAVKSIEQQSGNHVYLSLADDNASAVNKLTLDIQDKPFWQALDQLLDQAELTVNAFGEEQGLALVRRGEMAAPRASLAVYAQAFRIAPLDISATRDFSSGVGNTLQLQLEVAWEPRLAPIVVSLPMSTFAATDDAGNALTVQGGEQEYDISIGPGQSTVTLPLTFDLPARSAQKLAVLAGKLRVLLPGRQETFNFAKIDKAKKTSQTKAGVTVTIDEVWKNNNVWEVRVLTRFEDAAGSLQSHLNWVYNNEAKLLAPNGEEISYDSLETTSEEKNEIGMAYLFAREQGLADHTFIYRTPTTVTEVELDFEIKGLDLP